jgi:hypothetical protein
VHSFSGNNYVVDLTKSTCTCGRFQVNDIPCGHAIACLRVLNQAPREHIPEFFSLEHYYYTYEKNVQPVDVTALEAQATDNCLPPILKRGRGRPRTRRIRKVNVNQDVSVENVKVYFLILKIVCPFAADCVGVLDIIL